MTQKQAFIEALFRWLQNQRYVLLKHIDPTIHDLDDHSDLDILIPETLYEDLIGWIQTQPHLDKCRVERKVTMSQVFLFFQDDHFLQIDFLFGFFRKQWVYMNATQVLDYASPNTEGIKLCSPHHLLEHLFLFNTLNFAGIPQKYIDYFSDRAPHLQQRLKDYLNSKYHLAFSDWSTLATFQASHRRKIVQCLARLPINQSWRRWRNRWRYLQEIVGNIWLKRGFSMTFSGVDGAGKSTILAATKSILENKYRRNVVVLRHRPSLLPILSAFRYGKAEAEERSVSKLPRQGKNKSRLSSLLRFAYYYCDYLIGQLYVKVRYLWRGYVVLYDRYYFDFIIDGKRSNIDLPPKIPRLGYHFVHQPQLNLFLYADVETIRQRKQELPPESIQNLTQDYKQLFRELGARKALKQQYVTIENIDKDETIKQILERYKSLL